MYQLTRCIKVLLVPERNTKSEMQRKGQIADFNETDSAYTKNARSENYYGS